MRHFLLTRKSSVIIQFESETVDDLARADLEGGAPGARHP